MYYKSALLLLLVLFSAALFAKTTPFAAEVKQVELTKQDGYYLLSADMSYSLNDIAKEALNNGVPLYWFVVIKVTQQRPLLWNKTLAKIKIRYRLQYHALLNMYRIKNETTGTVDNFSTLAAALNAMSTLRLVPIIKTAALDAHENYRLAVKINFDSDALPLPLQPLAMFNPQWYFLSEWTLWPLKK